MTDSTSTTRLPRHQRVPHPPSMRLMARDLDILRAVATYRILRQDQLQALFFGSKSAAQYRLSHLYQHGFLARHFLPVQAGRSPTLYTIEKQGLETLCAAEDDAEPLKWTRASLTTEFLAHTLAINDVRVAVTLACRALHYPLVTWLGENDLKATYDRVDIVVAPDKRQSVSLIPDSYFVVETPRGKMHCFLELDRGTMTVNRFQTKIRAYQAYVERGQYQQRYQTRSLRVLTVTMSVKRLAHLKHATETVGGGRMFWFAILSALRPDSVLSRCIWEIAGLPAAQALVPPETA